jgi:nucleoside-diphosphate-sugar epimerase
MASLLVIGGTGFFGKSILDLFQRGGLEPWIIDRIIVMSRNAERLSSEAPSLLSTKVELISADISHTDYLPQADFVIHAAASSDARNYLARPLEEKKNIQAGVLNYCRLAKKFHPNSKIIFVSSGAVYGTQPGYLERIAENYSFTEPNDIPEGKRDYACAKRDGEFVIRKLGEDGLSVSIARCFAFVGPWLPLNQHFAIGNFIADGLAGRPITVKAKHKVYRSYMYVDDLVEWMMTIAHHSSPQCPTFNVGSDEAVLMGELAQIVAHEFGQNVNVPPIVDARVDRYVPAIFKIRDELGVEFQYDLPSAIAATVRAIRNRNQPC